MTSSPHIPSVRTGLQASLLALAVLACGWVQAQKIDDVPPAVQNNVPPNFMFMIDNSGSMSNIVPAAPFSAGTSYLASCASGSTVPAGTSVDLRVVGGVPRFTYGGTTFRHTTASGSEPARCFANNASYGARLLADNASGSLRAPGSYLDSEYSGNFLNWYFGNYGGPLTGWSDRKALAAGSGGAVETRMEIAKRSAKAAIDSLPLTGAGGRAGVRVGLSTYRNGGGGGALLAAMSDLTASSRTTLQGSIDALAPTGVTPLATTLADIGRYLSSGYTGNVATAVNNSVNIDTVLRLDGTDNGRRNACLAGAPNCSSTGLSAAQKPVQYWCQRSSIFALTDGRPQNDRGFDDNSYVRDYDRDCTGVNRAMCVSNGATGAWDRKLGRSYESAGSDYMDDVAKLLFDVDWRPDLAKPAPIAPAAAARNNISTYMIGFADPAVQNDPLLINTAVQGGGRFIAATDGPTLVDAFRSVITDALAKDASSSAVAVTSARITAGAVGYASSYNSGSWYGDLEAYSVDLSTGLQTGPTQWSARDKLNAQSPASRRIATFDGTRGVPFTTASGAALRAREASLSDALIDYTRGVRTGEGTTFRARSYLLGDIINAEPVVVNYASGPVVYQASNEGMLHAIDGRITGTASTRGQELWAYVPSLIHSRLAARANPIFQHQYLVDGTPATADVTASGVTTKVLVGGLGKGGAGYYALDITDGTAATEADAASKVLWEFRATNMGYSFGTPVIVNTAAGWRVVVASGYRNDTNPGGLGGDGKGRIWVLDPLTGAVEKEFVTPGGFGGPADPLGLAYLAAPSVAPGTVVRHVYGGDLQGNVWRVDLNAATNSTLVRVAAVTAPNGTAQPISVTPVVQPVAGSSSKFFLYFGTGEYFSIDDVPNTDTPNTFATQTQTIYGIVDDTLDSSPSLSNLRNDGSGCPANGGNGQLVCQSATAVSGGFNVTHNPVNLSSRRGFYLDLPLTGMRVNTQAALTRGGTLVVVGNVPSNQVCNPGGTAYEFQLSAATGGAVLKAYGGSEYWDLAVRPLADALSSRPVIVITDLGPRGLFRTSGKVTIGVDIRETTGSAPLFKRIYMRPLN